MDFPDQLREIASAPWDAGPLGEVARAEIAARLDTIGQWSASYLRLTAVALEREKDWVITHGEPHHANQLVTDTGLRLVDWESLMLAPRERDLVDVVDIYALDNVDHRMIELFLLEWRLTEIREYAQWFSRPHVGNEDDHIALNGLREELQPSSSTEF